jgi:poly-gamma-glutamate capsule biosynthesis protein CapA/YwtB (metallophosphatase superfamily)
MKDCGVPERHRKIPPGIILKCFIAKPFTACRLFERIEEKRSVPDSKNKEIVLYAVGDVGPNRKDPQSMFRHVSGFLKQGDIRFCQLETNLSTRGTPLPQARLPMRAHPNSARAFSDCGFEVISFASNHCMDFGQEAFFDTIDAIKANGMEPIGVGRNILEARCPAILERNGTRIAFLAYNSILPFGYWAENDRPGCAPMRAWTIYEQVEPDQPGSLCRTHTFPHTDDLEAMADDIEKAKSNADIVILSIHWGIHFVPAQLADYQRETARKAIDSGADLILGHHPHILKGIEVYKGKAIFYSLGNFAIEQPAAFMQDLYKTARHREIEELNPQWDEKSEYPLPPETRKSLIIKCTIARRCIQQISFVPVYIGVGSEPEILISGDERFEDVVRYIDKITGNQGIHTRFAREGDEVVVKTD